jgi:hypothetical protein
MSTSLEFTGSANGLKFPGTSFDLIDDCQGVLKRSSSVVAGNNRFGPFENRIDEGGDLVRQGIAARELDFVGRDLSEVIGISQDTVQFCNS